MNKLLLLLFAFLILSLTSCINSNDKSTAVKSENTISVDTIKSGIEAILLEDVGFWDKKQLSILRSNKWENAKTNQLLYKGSKVFVMEVDSEYVKVMTPINIAGFVVKTRIAPHISMPDSSLYFSKRDIRRIKTFVDGSDVHTVNLWNDKSKREKIVDKVYDNNPVAIIESDDVYVKLMTINGIEGWCMKGFLK